MDMLNMERKPTIVLIPVYKVVSWSFAWVVLQHLPTFRHSLLFSKTFSSHVIIVKSIPFVPIRLSGKFLSILHTSLFFGLRLCKRCMSIDYIKINVIFAKKSLEWELGSVKEFFSKRASWSTETKLQTLSIYKW